MPGMLNKHLILPPCRGKPALMDAGIDAVWAENMRTRMLTVDSVSLYGFAGVFFLAVYTALVPLMVPAERIKSRCSTRCRLPRNRGLAGRCGKEMIQQITNSARCWR